MMETTVFKGNKREIPGNLPTILWRDMVLEYTRIPNLEELPWYLPVMEYLSPDELNRVRAKALVWHEINHEWPSELAYWWEVRMARRRGDVPHMNIVVEARIDESGVLHCGFCDARWSSDHDGTPHPDRCKLCDRLWLVVEDARRIEVDA